MLRKVVHVTGVLYIPAYRLLGRRNTFLVVTALTLAAAVVDAAGIVPEGLLRSYEVRGISGFLSFGISAMLLTLMFPKHACFVAISASAVGDCISGIFKHVLKSDSNLASVMMFLSSIAAVHVLGLLNIKSVISILVGVLVERFVKSLDDNLTVPLSVGLTYSLLETVL